MAARVESKTAGDKVKRELEKKGGLLLIRLLSRRWTAAANRKDEEEPAAAAEGGEEPAWPFVTIRPLSSPLKKILSNVAGDE